MDNDLKEFMEEVKPKFKLKPFKKEITTLLFDGYSYNQILIFIEKKKKVKASIATLKRQINFWRKNGELIETSKDETSESLVKNEKKSENSSGEKMSQEEFMRRIKGER